MSTKLDKLRELLLAYQDLFHFIGDQDKMSYPCGDVVLELFPETEDPAHLYGSNMTGEYRMACLFFLGAGDYEVQIWVGEEPNWEENVDILPVMVVDYSCPREDDEWLGRSGFPEKGEKKRENVRTYITGMLDEFLALPEPVEDDTGGEQEEKEDDDGGDEEDDEQSWEAFRAKAAELKAALAVLCRDEVITTRGPFLPPPEQDADEEQNDDDTQEKKRQKM